jgi:hypothetical protein
MKPVVAVTASPKSSIVNPLPLSIKSDLLRKLKLTMDD